MRFTQFASPALALLACTATAAADVAYVTVTSCEEAPESTHPPSYDTSSAAVTVDVDLAVIGGGSGGIHAAIQLKDAGAKVVVIEKKNRIGGHAETFYPPGGQPINAGVAIFENSTSVSSYFARLRVNSTFFNPATDVPPGTPATKMYDFSLGFPIPAQNESATQAQNAAILSAAQSYMKNVIAKYPWIDEGFLVPEPVPEELYMPFGELAKKYSFEALLPLLAQYNWFTGDIATIPALYGIKGAGPGLLASFFGKFIVPSTRDTSTLYAAAAADLGDSVMLESTIVEVKRTQPAAGNNASSVTILINQPNQPAKLIRAKKLLVAIPQTLHNLDSFDLTTEEQDIFGKFGALGYWAGVVALPGLANSVRNIGIQTKYQQPIIPGPSSIELTAAPGYFTTSVGFNGLNYTEADGQDVIRASLRRLESAAAVPAGSATAATFPFSSDHGPFNLRVSPEDIKNGFYGKLAQLQGQHHTYWTGAAFGSHNSALIWNYNLVTIVPGLRKDLGL
ncbi:FAD dependent oxidoreductase family protein [Diplocarpon rosae]|nr:FAD dependent oxidoreductase family protein [Diplocarpon rosae]